MNFKKISVSSLLLAGIAMSPYALAYGQSFHGHTLNVAFEVWTGDDVLDGDDVLLDITYDKDVFAMDWDYPDEKDFYLAYTHTDLPEWDIDFNQNRIELTYTAIESNDSDHQYIYNSAKGFHFHDSENTLPEIINVRVDRAFTPPGFHPSKVTFDADNIYVNLNGSMCLYEEMLVSEARGVMPACTNQRSPTGYDNRIHLIVEFAAKETIYEATIDKLYDWAESKYPEYFPTHQESMDIKGYFARFYQETGVYIGSLKGSLYVYYVHLGVMIDLGELGGWVEKMEKEKMEKEKMEKEKMEKEKMDTEETDNK